MLRDPVRIARIELLLVVLGFIATMVALRLALEQNALNRAALDLNRTALELTRTELTEQRGIRQREVDALDEQRLINETTLYALASERLEAARDRDRETENRRPVTRAGQAGLLEKLAALDVTLSGINASCVSLPGVQLQGADLRGAVFTGADLQLARLEGATLTGRVDLRGADLRGAVLTEGADLTRAVLLRALLTDARLSGANLNGAVLAGADLRGADLRGADLTGAILAEADLTRAVLVDVEGLEQRQLDAACGEAAPIMNRREWRWAENTCPERERVASCEWDPLGGQVIVGVRR